VGRRKRGSGAATIIGRGIAVVLAAAFAAGAYLYLSLPDVRPLRTANPELTAFQALRAREARSRGKEPRHVQRWVAYGRISSHLKRAVLVAEDAKFWKHDGLDYEQMKESMEVNLERGEFARGASTITQQLAKNLYLSPAKTPVRKLREILIARRLEGELSKQRILELYLNVIEWGDGIYGAEAAARTYFGTSAAALGPQESALLAAAIVNPRVLDPGRPSARLRRRQQMIARRMGAATPPPVVVAAPPLPPPPPGEAAGEPPGDAPAAADPVVPASGAPAELPGSVPAAPEPPPGEPCALPPCR
jgi:monofunctional biosynthetic peptidoglycan transglycosylase